MDFINNKNDVNIHYCMISNIPSSYHSSDLRNFFSQFIESGKFECFHFRHRPEIKRPKECNIPNNLLNINIKENLTNTKCCITKIKKENFDELIKLYNRKHWIDRNEESLSTLCCISVLKNTKNEIGFIYSYTQLYVIVYYYIIIIII